MRRGAGRVLDDDLPFEEPTFDWSLPELLSVDREQSPAEDLGLRRLAEHPEVLLRRPTFLERTEPESPDAA